MAQIVRATDPTQLATVRGLFAEYAQAIGVDLSYQGFAAELAGLPGAYGPPGGALFLALVDGTAIGCAALRPLEAGSAEMKRLYVRPGQRGGRVGERLVHAVVDAARLGGYHTLKLDTLATMQAAQALYARLGFVPAAPYGTRHAPGTRFYALDLAGANPSGRP